MSLVKVCPLLIDVLLANALLVHQSLKHDDEQDEKMFYSQLNGPLNTMLPIVGLNGVHSRNELLHLTAV